MRPGEIPVEGLSSPARIFPPLLIPSPGPAVPGEGDFFLRSCSVNRSEDVNRRSREAGASRRHSCKGVRLW